MTTAPGTVAQPRAVGEVIESSSTAFVAQAYGLDGAPPLGSFVVVPGDGARVTYGVVALVETSGIDVGARPIMRGHGDVRDERIYEENPDLPLVLRTTFRVVIVGFSEGGRFNQYLPPHPPRLHFSVHLSSPDEVRLVTTAGLTYLGTLLNTADVPADEVAAANVRLTAGLPGVSQTFAREAGRELAQLLSSEYSRFTNILRRIAS